MIIGWKDRTSWEGLLDEVFSTLAGNDYRDVLQLYASTLKYVDDANDGYKLFSGRITKHDIISAILCKLSSVSRIKAYHACRTNDVQSYYNRGICPLDSEKAQKRFNSLFSQTDMGKLQEELDIAVAAVSTDNREGLTFLALDDRYLVEYSGHYLIYSSEYLNSLAINLPNGGEHTRDVLKRCGKATIFICTVPIEWINTDDMSFLAERMVADYMYSIAHCRSQVSFLDFTITVRGAIGTRFIHNHYHPTAIPDPFKSRHVWNDILSEYEKGPTKRCSI